MIIINPNSNVNFNIPNIDIAFSATKINAKVVDFNTKPYPKNRYLKEKNDEIAISIQSRVKKEAKNIKENYIKKFPDARVYSLKGPLNVQCCYPFVYTDDIFDLHLEMNDSLPLPDYTLFDSFDIFKKNWQKGCWQYAIMTSHGCPFPCKYCSSSQSKYKTRSAEHIIEELKKAKKDYNIKTFTIIDDCFNVNKERTLAICEKIKNLNIEWNVSNGLRADRFDEDIAISLKNSGFKHAMFGIESIHDDILTNSTKGENFAQINTAIQTAKKYFDVVGGFMIIGLPGSTYKKDMESFRWAYENKLIAHFSYYVPKEKLDDSIFYGKTAKPLSDVYNKKLQKKIFAATNYMRTAKLRIPIISNLLSKYRQRHIDNLSLFKY
jgi:radical SAM superfamily enzyme YgiQ (UPF0313 family)